MKEFDSLNEFISNWSGRKVGDKKFNEIFQVEGIPLSWFYRPILYSSLLPRPFPSVWKKEELQDANTLLLKGFSKLTSSFIYWSTKIKVQARKKVRMPREYRTGQKKVLFLTFTNHLYFQGTEKIPKLEKVLDKMEQDGKYKSFILAADLLSSLRLPALRKCQHTIFDYHNEEIWEKAKKKAEELHQLWKEIPLEIKEAWLQYEGKSYWGFAQPSLELLYSRQFIFAVAYYYELFQKALAEENAKVIVLTSQNNLFEKCILAAAKKHNIPALVIQHGMGLGKFKTIDLISRENFAVWGDSFRKSLLALGLKEENITVAGNLALDYLLEGEKGNSHILITTGPFSEDRVIGKEEYFRVVRSVVRELEKVKGERIIFKLHPRERCLSEYQKILQGKDNFSLVQETTREEYARLLRDSKLIITFGSSITLEAVALGKRALIIDLFQDKDMLLSLIPPLKSVPIIHWEKLDGAAIKDMMNQGLTPKQKKLEAEDVSDFVHCADGKTYLRIVNKIYEMAKG